MTADRPVVDDAVGLSGQDSVVAFVPRLGPARLRSLPLLLAILRRRLGGGARCLARALQLQHQFDQLVLAQTLKIRTAHADTESARSQPRKAPPSRPPPPIPRTHGNPVSNYCRVMTLMLADEY